MGNPDQDGPVSPGLADELERGVVEPAPHADPVALQVESHEGQQHQVEVAGGKQFRWVKHRLGDAQVVGGERAVGPVLSEQEPVAPPFPLHHRQIGLPPVPAAPSDHLPGVDLAVVGQVEGDPAGMPEDFQFRELRQQAPRGPLLVLLPKAPARRPEHAPQPLLVPARRRRILIAGVDGIHVGRKKGRKQRYPRVSCAHFTLNRMVQVGTKDGFGIPAGLGRVHARPPPIVSTLKCELGSKGFGERLVHCR